jgi:hypothetical protein
MMIVVVVAIEYFCINMAKCPKIGEKYKCIKKLKQNIALLL